MKPRGSAADADGAAIFARDIPRDACRDIGNARPDVKRRAVGCRIACDRIAGIGHVAAARVHRAAQAVRLVACRVIGRVVSEGTAGNGHRAAGGTDRAAVALAGGIASDRDIRARHLDCLVRSLSVRADNSDGRRLLFDRYRRALCIDGAAAGGRGVADDIAVGNGNRAAGGIDGAAGIGRIAAAFSRSADKGSRRGVDRLGAFHPGQRAALNHNAAAFHVQRAAVALTGCIARKHSPGNGGRHVQRADAAAVTGYSGIVGHASPVQVVGTAGLIDAAAVAGRSRVAGRVAGDGSGGGQRAAARVDTAAVHGRRVVRDAAADGLIVDREQAAAVVGRGVAGDRAVQVQRARGLVDAAAIRGAVAAARFGPADSAVIFKRHDAAVHTQAAAVAAGRIAENRPIDCQRARLHVNRAAVGGRVGFAFIGAADGAADGDGGLDIVVVIDHVQRAAMVCAVAGDVRAVQVQHAAVDVYRAAVFPGAVAGQLGVGVNRHRAAPYVHRRAVDSRVAGQLGKGVNRHLAAFHPHRRAVVAFGVLQRGMRGQREIRFFRGVLRVFHRHHHAGGVHLGAVDDDVLKRELAVDREHIACEGAVAGDGGHRMLRTALVFPHSRLQRDIILLVRGDGYRVGGAHRVVGDQHLDDGHMRFLLRDVSHRLLKRIEFHIADLAGVFGHVEQHQLRACGHVVEYRVGLGTAQVVGSILPLVVLGVEPYARDITGLLYGSAVGSIQRRLVVDIVPVRGQGIPGPIGRFKFTDHHNVVRNGGKTPGAGNGLRVLLRTLLRLRHGIYRQTVAGVGKGQLVVIVHIQLDLVVRFGGIGGFVDGEGGLVVHVQNRVRLLGHRQCGAMGDFLQRVGVGIIGLSLGNGQGEAAAVMIDVFDHRRPVVSISRVRCLVGGIHGLLENEHVVNLQYGKDALLVFHDIVLLCFSARDGDGILARILALSAGQDERELGFRRLRRSFARIGHHELAFVIAGTGGNRAHEPGIGFEGIPFRQTGQGLGERGIVRVPDLCGVVRLDDQLGVLNGQLTVRVSHGIVALCFIARGRDGILAHVLAGCTRYGEAQ